MTTNKEVARELKNLSKAWKESEAVKVGFNSLPDGEYVAEITDMSVGKSKNGRLQVTTTFKIIGGEENGNAVKRFDGLNDAKSIGYFKGMAEVIGLDLPNDITLLPDVLEAFVNECNDRFSITVKTKNEYQNVYINGVADIKESEEELEKEGDEEPEEEGDEEPEEEGDEEPEEEGEKEKYKKPTKKPYKR